MPEIPDTEARLKDAIVDLLERRAAGNFDLDQWFAAQPPEIQPGLIAYIANRKMAPAKPGSKRGRAVPLRTPEQVASVSEKSAGANRVGGVTLRTPEQIAHASEKPEVVGKTIADSWVLGDRYKLLQQIGKDGKGEVWQAEQQEPTKRLVVIKFPKTDADTKEVLAHFEAERKTLELLDHPHIAKVLDAGSTPNDQPFFVMELVKGVPITQYCDEAELSPRERLELFILVCQAVQYAHQKGIIHHDLKPSNLVIDLQDGKPSLKINDFGIAKAIHQKQAAGTLMSLHGARIGTLEYMSPEQAESNNLDVDTRADIYSLGVVMYEMLTGHVPFNSQELSTGAENEMHRVIREVTTSKPSSKLSSPQNLLGIATQRKLEPKRLTQIISGELDCIVMKCLEKDRNRRYESAVSLAEDIQRYLRNEPIQARPPGSAYLLHKFYHRNRRTVLATAATLTVLLLGIAVALIGSQRTPQQNNQGVAPNSNGHNAAELTDGTNGSLARQLAFEKKLAEAQLAKSEWLIYTTNIRSAQEAWNNNKADLALRYLLDCRPDFRGWEHDYLFTKFHDNQVTLRLETGSPATAASISADGNFIAGGGGESIDSGVVKVWDSRTGELAFELKGQDGIVGSLCFSPDGKWIISGSKKSQGELGEVKVWSASLRRALFTLKSEAHGINCVHFSPDNKRFAAGCGKLFGHSGEAVLWNVSDGKVLHTLKGHASAVTSLNFSPDGKTLVSGSSGAIEADGGFVRVNAEVKVWEVDTGRNLLTFKTGIHVKSVAFSPDGKRIITVSDGGDTSSVRVWDAKDGKLLMTVGEQSLKVNCVCYSPDGRSITTANADSTVRVYDSLTGKERYSLKGHTDIVNSVAYSTDSKRMVTASDDGTVKVWVGNDSGTTATETKDARVHSLSDRKPSLNWPEERKSAILQNLICIDFRLDCKRVVSSHTTSNKSGELLVWDALTGEKLQTFKGHNQVVSAVSFSPDCKRVASMSATDDSNSSCELKVWEAETGNSLLTIRMPDGQGNSVSFSPDGKQVFTAHGQEGKYGEIKLWDAQSGKELMVLKGHADIVTCVAIHPGGKRVVSSSKDGTLKVWNAENGQELCSLKGQQDLLTPFRFSADGKRLVVKNTVPGMTSEETLIDASNGLDTSKLQGADESANCICFSPDGTRIASGYGDGSYLKNPRPGGVTVWDAKSGRQILALKGHQSAVATVVFSTDGEQLATGSNDSTAILWNARTGEESHQLRGHKDSVNAVHFSPDGLRLATGSTDKTIRVWDTRSGAEILVLQGHTLGVNAVRFSPDGKWIASGAGGPNDPGELKIWNLETATVAHSLTMGKNGVESISFRGDGRRVAARGNDDSVRVWDAESGRELSEQPDWEFSNWKSATSPNGKYEVRFQSGLVLIDRDKAKQWKSEQRERLSQLTKVDPDWHARQAVEAHDAKHWLALAFHNRRLIETYMSDPLKYGDKRKLALSYAELGQALFQLDQKEQALDAVQKATALVESIPPSERNNVENQVDQRRIYSIIGLALLQTGQTKQALEIFGKCLSISEHLAQIDPKNVKLQRDISVCLDDIGATHLRNNDSKAALEIFQKSLVIREILAKEQLWNVPTLRDLSTSRQKLGDLNERAGDFSRAAYEYSKGLDSMKLSPQPEELKDDVRVLTERLKFCRLAEKVMVDPFEAMAQPAALRADLLADCMFALVKQRKADKAIRAAELLAEKATNPDDVCTAACGYSLCSTLTDSNEVKDLYGKRAVELLRLAIRMGYQNLAGLKKYTDLDPIRDRDDFKQILADLEKKNPGK